MQIEDWWPRLTPETRDWLIAHNGEPLDTSVRNALLEVTQGEFDASWWAGDSEDGGSELSDAAIDWIEATANAETAGA
jgi:hypothetical protein